MTINQALLKAMESYKSGDVLTAKRLLSKIIQNEPSQPDANSNMGAILVASGDLEEALPYIKTALEANFSVAQYWFNYIDALFKLGRLAEALELLAVARGKGCKGQAFDELEKKLASPAVEVEQQNKMLQTLDEDEPYAYFIAFKIGETLQNLGKRDEAIKAYNKSIAIKPDYAEAHNDLGTTLQELGRLDEALASYSQAKVWKPDFAEAYYNIGNVLREQGKLQEAIEAYNKALKIQPDYELARAYKISQQANICDWDSISKDRKLIPKLGTSEKLVTPFSMLSFEDAPERHRLRSEIYAKARYPQEAIPLPAVPSKKPKRLRIGYFSADFKEHPISYLIAKVLEQHNRDQFEVFGYPLQGFSSGDMWQRIKNSFDCVTDVQGMNNKNIALRARQDEIDIAIDLSGYTQGSRTGIFAYRAAPIQINYLGYPGTLGADFMDYIIADKYLIPPENQKYFTEKQLYLPNTYMPTDDSRELSKRSMSRSDMGLPDEAFVFCCFNNNYKITSSEFDIWMRLLTKVAGSVLWIRKSNQLSDINMKKEAQKRKVDPSRLVFAERVPMNEHLTRHKLADLFIDTFAFNAQTTTTEALWTGLPVVTKMGQGFAARVAGSLLNAVGLPELITENEQDYEALILELATNSSMLATIKEKLSTNLLVQPLFDTEQYTRHLEDGYQQAYQNYFDGKAPQTIIVKK